MNKQIAKASRQQRAHNRVRAKISGTAARPRLSVARSNRNLQLQLIDDVAGKTLVAAHSREVKDGDKTAKAAAAGKLLAGKAVKLGVEQVVFDRGSRLYHGRVKAAAEGARDGGLKF